MQTGLAYGFSLLAGAGLVLTSSVAWVTENTHWPATLNIVRGREGVYTAVHTECCAVLCGQRAKKLHNVLCVCMYVCVCVTVWCVCECVCVCVTVWGECVCVCLCHSVGCVCVGLGDVD